MAYRSFEAFVAEFVLPLRRANPGWVQLDGGNTSNPSTVAKFEHEGSTWEVHADTHVDAVLLAYEDATTGNPFVRVPSRSGKRDCLCLRPDLAVKIDPKYKYFYVYDV